MSGLNNSARLALWSLSLLVLSPTCGITADWKSSTIELNTKIDDMPVYVASTHDDTLFLAQGDRLWEIRGTGPEVQKRVFRVRAEGKCTAGYIARMNMILLYQKFDPTVPYTSSGISLICLDLGSGKAQVLDISSSLRVSEGGAFVIAVHPVVIESKAEKIGILWASVRQAGCSLELVDLQKCLSDVSKAWDGRSTQWQGRQRDVGGVPCDFLCRSGRYEFLLTASGGGLSVLSWDGKDKGEKKLPYHDVSLPQFVVLPDTYVIGGWLKKEHKFIARDLEGVERLSIQPPRSLSHASFMGVHDSIIMFMNKNEDKFSIYWRRLVPRS